MHLIGEHLTTRTHIKLVSVRIRLDKKVTDRGTDKASLGVEFKISYSNVLRDRKHLPGVLSTAALSLMFH